MSLTLIATGGTIASRASASGAVASVQGQELLAAAAPFLPADLEVEVSDLDTKSSFALTLQDMRDIAGACLEAIAAGAQGMVVTHGTDSMEETAFMTDLFHHAAAPVIFTGAQRTFDSEAPDGPANLAFALRSAADARNSGRGVLIAFDGALLPARGARKVHTWHPHAFDNPSTDQQQRRSTPESIGLHQELPEVAVVLGLPGSDGRAVRDALAHRPAGLVYQGIGIGNASPGDAAALADALQAGVPVLVTSRVPHGPVRPVYGSGGGRTLHDAGAVMAGDLTTAQARVLLAVCLADGEGGARRAQEWICTHGDT